MKFERKLVVIPAFDKRETGHGVHGAEMRFYLKGEKGVVQFVIYTNWMLPHLRKGKYEEIRPPMPADLGYHSYKPIYEGQTFLKESCPLLEGRPCYYDGSSLAADDVFEVLVSKGHEAMWEILEKKYAQVFEEGKNI